MQPGPLLESVGQAEVRALRILGYETMRDAKNSLQPGPRPSPPGQPPRSKLGTLKRHIRYAVDDQRRVMVAGPEYLPRESRDVPEALEHGGISIAADGTALSVAARPFVRPAFARTLQTVLPRAFANSVQSPQGG